jgi:hypothetical protein
MKVESTEWAECMMNYLITIFKEGHGFRKLPVPDKVTLSTSEYKNETDVVGRFIAEFIHPLDEGVTEGDPVNTGMLNREFQRWKQENNITSGSTVELKKRMETVHGQHPRSGWTSFRFGPA